MKIQGLYSGGVITNYRCPSRCKHCLYNCGPERSGEYISLFTAEKIFSCLKKEGCRSIHVGGGEPFLNFEGLLEFSRSAMNAGIGIEYIETNSAWFKNHEDALEKLERLMSVGVDCLLLSVSPFHNEYIPLKKFDGVTSACREAGMRVFPWIGEFYNELSAMDHNEKHSLSEYAALTGDESASGLIYRYSLTMRGRALQSYRDQLKRTPYRSWLDNSEPCGNLSGTSHFHIDLYGNYIPGLCTGLSVPIADLGSDLPTERYPLLNALYEGGVRAAAKIAEDCGWSPEKDSYVSKCELCTEIRCYMNKAGESEYELKPREFYDEYDN